MRWSPYIVGAGIGILSWLTFLLSDKALGCSTAFARTSGMIRKMFGNAGKVDDNAYYKKFPPIIDWEWMLVLGILIGAAVSALLSGDFHLRAIPPLWEASFGSS
ncbi:MAG: YeeE/YedE family protein, partial [Candidatus Aegiribacteria sp.]|nr:YeeE/YedE family protein [Candidatus Aegiribacteria sp.]